ncbi:NAD-dependent epimerase/dehydratase family protein [Nocardiopsis halophila]|uniref:NAD-dependent epimerase/dehydratase family protein n=1 Tax=Nocardiopsis halophila TaxID=141692 RepID=UPI00034D157B|nr:NAD-dependent epimerase/dehydratase [Nocardiopsis halophila]
MALRPPLVAVLGATGFIGSAVLAECAARPLRVRAVSRRPAEVPPGARAEIELSVADLTEPGAVARAIDGADVIVHTVAHIGGSASWRVDGSDRTAERVNLGLMHDAVTALGRRPLASGPPPVLVFAGAVTQAGPVTGAALTGTETDRPEGLYDRQKLAAEHLLMEADRAGSVRGVSLRLPAVFGSSAHSAGVDKGVVSSMVRRALAGERLTLWHNGTVLRDLLYVEDAARAFALAIEHGDTLAGRHWVLGSGDAVPLREVFRLIARRVAAYTGGPEAAVVQVPAPDYADAGDFRDLLIDPSAFSDAVGWRAQVTLEEALDRTVAHEAESSERTHQ